MPQKDKHLTDIFKGRVIKQQEMEANDWYDQGSSNYHYGLPRKKNYWVKRLFPTTPCCHTVFLFILMTLDENVIKSIDTAVHQAFNDGSYEDLRVPFFEHDYDNAKKEIQAICEQSIDSKKKPFTVPVNLNSFVNILGTNVKSQKAKRLINKYKLRESLGVAALGAGYSFKSDDNKIEMQADMLGNITTAWTRLFDKNDILIGDLSCISSRKDVIAILGTPNRSDKDGSWDRFDYKDHCLHMQYNDKKKLHMITIMLANTAP